MVGKQGWRRSTSGRGSGSRPGHGGDRRSEGGLPEGSLEVTTKHVVGNSAAWPQARLESVARCERWSPLETLGRLAWEMTGFQWAEE